MSEQQPAEVRPLSWDELKPYEKDQGGYWLYPPGRDVYGNGKIWVSVPNPEHVQRETDARAALGAATDREADAGMALWRWLQGSDVEAILRYRSAVLAGRALAVSWSEFDETVPPRDRIIADMRELTAIADSDHRARRQVRTAQNLDAYRDEIRRADAAKLRAMASVMHHVSSRELLERAAEDIEPDDEETT